MPPFILQLLEQIAVRLITHLLKANLEREKGPEPAVSDAEAFARVGKLREAYVEAFDGTEMTPEQRKKLNESIAAFIRGGPSRL